MAETIIAAAISDVVSRVISLVLRYFSHQQSTEAKLDTICHMLIRIQSVIEEAKGRHILNHGTLQWLSELIDVEYQGRYLLDTIGCDKNYNDQDQDQHGKVPHVSTTISLLNPAKRARVTVAGSDMRRLSNRHHDLGVYEIDKVQERLRDASCDLREFIMLLQSCQSISRPLATNIFREGQMFGRHVEKERIINFLLDTSSCSTGEVGVLPIVGDNGVGKTTLAQHACDDARVRRHFAMIMLCCTYTITTNGGTPVLRSKLSIGDAGIYNQNDPLQLLKDHFCDKRILMVFEDVDTNKMQMLKGLFQGLGCSKKGSKIIITTKDRHVAAIGTVEPIRLKVFPFSEYWFFFKAHAFAGRDVEENPRLVKAGKAIAMKLNGSFFGAKIVGAALRDQSVPKFWDTVLRNIAGLSLLGDAIVHVWDLADNLLPGHMVMSKMSVYKSPFAYQTTDMARLQDICRADPHASKITCWADSARLEKVLLCKSVFPFHNSYHIARCVCTCVVGTPNCHLKVA